MIGQVLVKQDLDESKQNVEKQIDYISKEMQVEFACIDKKYFVGTLQH